MKPELNFSDRVVFLRRSMGLRQPEFAELLHISRPYLSQIESGREPSPALQDLFARLEKDWNLEGSPSEQMKLASTLKEQPAIYGARSRLRQSREAKGLSPSEVAHAVGYSLDVYQNIEDGRASMGQKMAQKVAKLLGIPVDDLTNGSDHPPSSSVPFGSFGSQPDVNMGPGMEGQRAKYVPLLSLAQCGTMSAYSDEGYTGEGFVAYSPDDPRAFAVRLAGDSMQPRIEPGDIAVVYPSKTPRNGSVVLARLDDDHGGDVMCKLYQANRDEITLSSYNPAFPPLTYPRDSFAWIYPVNSVTKVFS